MVVAVGKWSLFRGGRQLRFDCIFYYKSLHGWQEIWGAMNPTEICFNMLMIGELAR